MLASASAKSHVLLLSLDLSSPFNQIYQRLLKKLSAVAALNHAHKPEPALEPSEPAPARCAGH
jgi:hypothetical protein